MEYVTTGKAAKIIGCSPQQVRTLVRNGKLEAIKEESPNSRTGYVHMVSLNAVRAYRRTNQSKGWPRGKRRKQA